MNSNLLFCVHEACLIEKNRIHISLIHPFMGLKNVQEIIFRKCIENMPSFNSLIQWYTKA